MAKNLIPALAEPLQVQHARFVLTIGQRTNMTADVQVTSSGLLAIGALVSTILLSTAVIVRAARR